MNIRGWILATGVAIGTAAPSTFAIGDVAGGADTLMREKQPPPWNRSGFSFAYWFNGWRKHPGDDSPDILCFETGHYGLALDPADFNKTRFGPLDDAVGYTQALRSDSRRMETLDPASLVIEVEIGNRTYRAVASRAGIEKGPSHLYSARLWESGKLVQHFDLLGLVFQDNEGDQLACDGTLDLVAWPDSLTLNLELAPEQTGWSDAVVRMGLNDWRRDQAFAGQWDAGVRKKLTLNCNLGEPKKGDGPAIRVGTAERPVPVVFDPSYNCNVARVQGPKHNRNAPTQAQRDYDEFDILIENRGDSTRLPFLLNLTHPANITGLCPILCDDEGKPTGIPVQLSKNWHLEGMGAYLRAYALIPAPPGESKYKLRIAYGFYGTLPSASHAQLSLIGWGSDTATNGNNGRWDQLAIGCWGETFCFDMDMSCVDVAITDVRMLMARNGLEGKKWGWTDAGWGGDWLHLQNDLQEKLYFSELKTGYISHGPCLTEVRYDGYYGAERQVDLQATVRTLRTDDYARTFQTFRYKFTKPVSAMNGWLFKMGRTEGCVTPRLAYGNEKGLMEEHRIPNNLRPNETFIGPITLTGSGPWWVAFPGAFHANGKNWGTGSRALVIRSYQATIDGQRHSHPTLSAPVYQVHEDGRPNLDLLLTPPPGVTAFGPGDSIDFDVEWITLHRVADDYYGPNEAYRQHLEKNPGSWKTVHREAAGNNLEIQTVGGTVKHTYPLIIEAAGPGEVRVNITGGIGAVPVRFDGLESPAHTLFQVIGGKRIRLDQSVHGNDFWETGYDPESDTYSLTFNLPLDGQPTSEWILRPDKVPN